MLGIEATRHRREDRFESIAEHLASVADALEYAHGQGVIHRDIKPHNLILSEDGRLHITDFGLARVLEQPGVTVTGEFIGSPLYTAPEQIAGEGTRVDSRVDIYSLAATMYEWLTLRPPFPGKTRESVIAQVLRGEPTPPRSLDPAIPVDLETICLRAMERNPDRRYRSAAEFRDDLRAFLAGRRIRARRAGWSTRARRWMDRHPAVSLTAAAAAVAIALTAYFWSVSAENRKIETALSERETRVVAEEERLEEQAAQLDSLIDSISALSPERLVEKGAELAPKVPGYVGAAFTTENVASLFPETRVSAEVGTLAGIAGRVVEDLFRASGSPLDTLRVQTLAIDPRLLVLRTAMDAADPVAAMRSIDPFVRDPSDYTARFLRTLLNARAGRYESMATDAAILVQFKNDDPNAHLLRGLADLLVNQWEQAIADCDRAVTLAASSELAWVVRGLASLQLGLTREALADFDTALSLSPDLVVGRLGRAFASFIEQRPEAAIADCTHVLKLEPNNVDALVARGEFFRATFAYDEALNDFTRAQALKGISLSARVRIAGMLYSTRLSRQSRVGRPSDPRPTGDSSSVGESGVDTVESSDQAGTPLPNTSGSVLPGFRASAPEPRGVWHRFSTGGAHRLQTCATRASDAGFGRDGVGRGGRISPHGVGRLRS